MGKIWRTRRNHLILLKIFPRFQPYASHPDSPPRRIRYPEDRHFTNRGKLVNNRFDFTGVDIFSACNNHVLQAVQDVEIPICILIADWGGPVLVDTSVA